MRIIMDNEEQKQKAAVRIKALRKELGLGQIEFAEFLGMGAEGQPTVSKWERARQAPGAEYSARLSQKTGRSALYYSGLDEISEDGEVNGRKFPLVGDVQAGSWKEAVERQSDEQELVMLPSAVDVPPYVMKAFKVRGGSMNMIYPEGSVVFVAGLFDNPITPVDGDIVMVQRQSADGLYEATLKELVVDDDGRRWLWPRSTEPEHQAPLSVDDGRDSSTDVTILGIVQAGITVPQKRKQRTR